MRGIVRGGRVSHRGLIQMLIVIAGPLPRCLFWQMSDSIVISFASPFRFLSAWRPACCSPGLWVCRLLLPGWGAEYPATRFPLCAPAPRWLPASPNSERRLSCLVTCVGFRGFLISTRCATHSLHAFLNFSEIKFLGNTPFRGLGVCYVMSCYVMLWRTLCAPTVLQCVGGTELPPSRHGSAGEDSPWFSYYVGRFSLAK